MNWQERSEMFEEQSQIRKCLDAAAARGYPKPEIFTSEHGYKKARCPLSYCRQECLLKGGYTHHYLKSHTEEGKMMSRKGAKYKTYSNSPSLKVTVVDDSHAAWHTRAYQTAHRLSARGPKLPS